MPELSKLPSRAKLTNRNLRIAASATLGVAMMMSGVALGASVTSIKVAMHRLRQGLRTCIERHPAAREAS